MKKIWKKKHEHESPEALERSYLNRGFLRKKKKHGSLEREKLEAKSLEREQIFDEINSEKTPDLDKNCSGQICVKENQIETDSQINKIPVSNKISQNENKNSSKISNQIRKINEKLNRKVGISLIALVITIIIIIILAAIVMMSSVNTVDSASYAKFAHEISEIQTSTDARRAKNAINGPGEENHNKGFTKVLIDNEPDSFVSFDDDAVTGYVVDLDFIEMKDIKTGREELTEKRVTFGREDVYVYDSEGKVYYAKGYPDDDGRIHYKVDEVGSNTGIVTQPIISKIEYEISENKQSAIVTIIAAPTNGGELTVTGGGKSASKTGENTYQLVINQNGTIQISVKESDGGRATQSITISGIEVKVEYTISYNANGGSGAPSSHKVKEGETTQISNTKPNREGYEFKGWATSQTNANNGNVAYSGGESYVGNGNLTLYAVWEVVTIEVSSLTISEITEQTYTGLAIEPKPIVKDGSKTLTLNTHYTLSYSNNTNVGTATITVIGKGSYVGSQTITFEIVKANMNGIKVIEYEAEYDGEAHGIEVELTGTSQGATVKYGTTAGSYTQTVSPRYTEVGTYTIHFEVSKENYNTETGSATVIIRAITMDTSGSVEASKRITISSVPNQEYTGSEIRPEPTVKYGSKTLTLNTDYTLSYTNNTNVGTATITVTGKGNYTGTVSTTFEIVKANMTGITVTGHNSEYDGLAHGISVNLKETSQGATVKYGEIAGNYNLTSSPTYTNEGTYTVYYQITKTNYETVTGSENVNITARMISSSTVTVGTVSGQTYTGSEIKPEPTVKYSQAILVLNRDYILGYNNNTNAGTATITVTGQGNYKGTITATFTISRKSINVATVKLGTTEYTYDGTTKEPTVAVEVDGRGLANGSEYTVSYTDNVNAGTATVTITGVGNYTGTITTTFTILPKLYTVTYNANGGELGEVPSTESKTHDEAYTITDKVPTREGYTFLGWSTDSTAITAEYNAGDEYITNAELALYAIWEEEVALVLANPPVLGKNENGELLMQAVYWSDENATDEIVSDEFTSEMYSYVKGDNVTDTKQARWANAKTIEDGSYWVWIPRYAYKITYYTDDTKATVSTDKTQYGSIDIVFLKGTSNSEYYDDNGNIVTTGLPAGYTVHPAFQAMTTAQDLATNPLGKWDSELEGIWVAKYEASQGSSGKPESKPSVQSWRSITQSDIYTACESLNSTLGSHEMKNSEWGAVAYLTYSAYGRNGNELAVNQCSNYYTGGGPGTGNSTVYNSTYSYDSSTFASTYAWNTTQGKLASTTGNIYGIYDMLGGAHEYVAAYVNNRISSLTNYGANMVNSSNLRNKQIYAKGSSDNEQNNYSANSGVYGDGVYEISASGTGSTSWCGDYSYFPYSSIPFFGRGGYRGGTSGAGVFCFDNDDGSDYSSVGFRPVLCVSSSTSDTESLEDGITYDANGGTFGESTKNYVTYESTTGTVRKVSGTSNISEDGTDSGAGYGNGVETVDVITIPGATSLNVTITYQTQGTSYDWVCLYNGSVTPNSINYADSVTGTKLGGTTKSSTTVTVTGDTVQIYFRSDDSSCSYYGYYAEITGVGTVYNVTDGEYKEPTRDGGLYVQTGWSASADATEAEYGLGADALKPESGTLYAVWGQLMDLIPSVANAPVLGTGMQAVYWSDENASQELTATSHTTNMYNYILGDGQTDSKTSRWANAKTTSDGSYWVWIPRYAYKITYTNISETNVSVSKSSRGNVDILFMYGISDTHYRDINGEAQPLPAGYTVHPAFQAMTTTADKATNPLGKWDSELEGIWVAKYEASKGSSGKPESKPSVHSWRSITQSDIYTACENLNSTLGSHEMKNSEWGAVAYLTYSAYGRNGNELAVNECYSNYTGAGPNTGASNITNGMYPYNSSTFASTYAWNKERGKLASTTGNIYGIYDMSGGSGEYVAAYVNNGKSSLTNYGSNMINSSNLRNKQIYAKGSSDNQQNNYNANNGVYGDAVYETSTSCSGAMSWCNDSSSFPVSFNSFFERGGNYRSTSDAGVFHFGGNQGPDNSYLGFRPVLCVRVGT